MRDWTKAAMLAALLIAPGFGPIAPSENAEHWMMAVIVIAAMITVLVMWGHRKIDYKAREIAARNTQIADANKLLDALEDARINAHLSGDEGHSTFLNLEVISARGDITRWQREIREIESGLDPDRNSNW